MKENNPVRISVRDICRIIKDLYGGGFLDAKDGALTAIALEHYLELREDN